MIHSKNNLKTDHKYKLINLLNQPAQFNQQEGSNFKTLVFIKAFVINKHFIDQVARSVL